MRMRIAPAATLLSAALLILPGALLAGEGQSSGKMEMHKESAKEVTVKGEILDMACYLSHGAMGADHAACAKRCAMSGEPMGLLTDDGTIYLLTAIHGDTSAFDHAKELAGQKVVMTGVTAGKGNLMALEVHKVEAQMKDQMNKS